MKWIVTVLRKIANVLLYSTVLFTTVCASSVNKITFDLKVRSQVKIASSNITLHLKTHTSSKTVEFHHKLSGNAYIVFPLGAKSKAN